VFHTCLPRLSAHWEGSAGPLWEFDRLPRDSNFQFDSALPASADPALPEFCREEDLIRNTTHHVSRTNILCIPFPIVSEVWNKCADFCGLPFRTASAWETKPKGVPRPFDLGLLQIVPQRRKSTICRHTPQFLDQCPILPLLETSQLPSSFYSPAFEKYQL
jgi:hypothetical protein